VGGGTPGRAARGKRVAPRVRLKRAALPQTRHKTSVQRSDRQTSPRLARGGRHPQKDTPGERVNGVWGCRTRPNPRFPWNGSGGWAGKRDGFPVASLPESRRVLLWFLRATAERSPEGGDTGMKEVDLNGCLTGRKCACAARVERGSRVCRKCHARARWERRRALY
jgi:hypothetical protein